MHMKYSERRIGLTLNWQSTNYRNAQQILKNHDGNALPFKVAAKNKVQERLGSLYDSF